MQTCSCFNNFENLWVMINDFQAKLYSLFHQNRKYFPGSERRKEGGPRCLQRLHIITHYTRLAARLASHWSRGGESGLWLAQTRVQARPGCTGCHRKWLTEVSAMFTKFLAWILSNFSKNKDWFASWKRLLGSPRQWEVNYISISTETFFFLEIFDKILPRYVTLLTYDTEKLKSVNF